jgi:putative ABC transport system permease protein
MFTYYLDLARRSFRRNLALTVLMVVAIAFGVGASMTTLTVLHVLAADPIPGKSHKLYRVQIEPRKANRALPGQEPPDQVGRDDGEGLLRAARADHQAWMTSGGVALEPDRAGLKPFLITGRWTSADFFPMFEPPFASGGAWTAADDANHAHVAVITRTLADKVFGTTDAVGKSLRVGGTPMRITGVLDRWNPEPHFYDLDAGIYGVKEEILVPMETALELKFGHQGNTNCWDSAPNGEPQSLGAPCVWSQFWAELDSPAKADAYREFLVKYSLEQKAAGRFERDPSIRLRDVTDWLKFKEVVPNDARLQTWIALGFLLVCLINTVGLLLTKFLRRSGEIGVRRALGASKRSIFFQLLVEAGTIGVAGGALGLLLAWAGLWAVRHQPTSYAELAELDLPMLAATFALAVFASLLAGLLPAWRGCQVTPAIQLKSH